MSLNKLGKGTPRRRARGQQYPGLRGKIVAWVEHKFEEDLLYIHIRFADKTELCWRIGTSILIEEADLSDWKTSNFKQLGVFAQGEARRDR
jgi:hypothetical protein